MDNEKNSGFTEGRSTRESEFGSEGSAPRARNRTVMLTPDVTGEVRARLQQDLGVTPPPAPRPGPAGFESPQSGGFSIPEKPARRETTGSYTVPSPKTPSADESVIWAKEGPLVGVLVSYDVNPNGNVFELRTGRLIVTSEAPGGGSYLYLNDPSVSPMHAIIRISNSGEIQVLDQLSEFGTRIQRFGAEQETELSGQMSSLEHGDVIKFGNRKFHVCIVQRGDRA